MSTVFNALVSSLVPRTLLSSTSSSSLYDYHSVFTSPPPLKMLSSSHGRRRYRRSSSSDVLSSNTISTTTHYYTVTVLTLIFIASLLQQSVMANPVPTTELISPTTTLPPDGTVRKICDNGEQQSSSGTESPCSLEDTFRNHLMKDSKNQVYIDTLTPEEAAEHAKTGRLPKRTMELIEKVLMDQKQKDENTSKSGESNSNEAADLYDELFNRNRKRT